MRSESVLHRASGQLEVEQIIDGHVARASSPLVRVAGSLWSRDLTFADGSRIECWIILEVSDWRCLDCGIDLRHVDEYYMVRDDLWNSAVVEFDRHRHLCIGCLESRLGRELTNADFRPGTEHLTRRATPRLRDRLGRAAPPDRRSAPPAGVDDGGYVVRYFPSTESR
ncbi:hypothetical protein [Tsukamurella soli]|uniref:hypothetical protein n=1 Tax=Tsukamurella soli TaxID=644556 RepID=UPI003607FD44